MNESWFVQVGIVRERHEAVRCPSRTACVLTSAITSPQPAKTLFSDTAPFRASLRFGRTADPRHTITAQGTSHHESSCHSLPPQQSIPVPSIWATTPCLVAYAGACPLSDVTVSGTVCFSSPPAPRRRRSQVHVPISGTTAFFGDHHICCRRSSRAHPRPESTPPVCLFAVASLGVIPSANDHFMISVDA